MDGEFLAGFRLGQSLQCLTASKYEHMWTAAVDHGKLDLSIKRRGVNGQQHGRPL
jgi:hypothetical protein